MPTGEIARNWFVHKGRLPLPTRSKFDPRKMWLSHGWIPRLDHLYYYYYFICKFKPRYLLSWSRSVVQKIKTTFQAFDNILIALKKAIL